jgi:hypothetical protein
VTHFALYRRCLHRIFNKKEKKTSEGHFFDCMNQTKQQVSSRTCHPENIRLDMVLKEAANDSMD